MPSKNRFRPQQYFVDTPSAPYELISPAAPQVFAAPDSQLQMRRLGERLFQARVQRVILVHGTLAGTDALGILGHVDRFLPDVARSLGELRKRMVDAVIGDVGNYSQEYADQFARSLVDEKIPGADNDTAKIATRPQFVDRFLWSSENHHLGRAWAAVNLLAELFATELKPDDRILLWGHSHAGNVFAIVSNLLGGTADDLDRFFTALWPDVSEASEDTDLAVFESVKGQLNNEDASKQLAKSIDFVTFGTPIRYGWESDGFRSLMHFVNHQPMVGVADWRARYPQSMDEIREALLGATGDYVQLTFIAGTDFPPSILSRDARQANKDLGELIEPNTRRRDLLKQLRTGPRVAADGTTLLVNYGGDSVAQNPVNDRNSGADSDIGARQLAGHGVYTTLAWLPFHLNEVVRRIYNEHDN